MWSTGVKVLQLSSLHHLNLIRVLALFTYLGAMCLLVAAGVLIAAFDFTTEYLCKTAINICLSFFSSFWLNALDGYVGMFNDTKFGCSTPA